jgi:hypothetical protein
LAFLTVASSQNRLGIGILGAFFAVCASAFRAAIVDRHRLFMSGKSYQMGKFSQNERGKNGQKLQKNEKK